MTRLLRSPFPVAPKAPALLQHHLFGGPPEPVDADEASAVSTPAMRRWCEIGGPEIEEARHTQGAVSTDREKRFENNNFQIISRKNTY